jgi:hypothetical protein
MSRPNAPLITDAITGEMLRTLAATGAICSECGGMCASHLETLIIAANVSLSTGVRIPFCECSACRVCGALNKALERIHAAPRSQSRRSD